MWLFQFVTCYHCCSLTGLGLQVLQLGIPTCGRGKVFCNQCELSERLQQRGGETS